MLTKWNWLCLMLVAMLALGTVACNGSDDDDDDDDTGAMGECGDGNVDEGETCDDGDQDSCTGDCNATCSGPSTPEADECMGGGEGVCGDGTVDEGETCDDGETDPCTGDCNADCSGPSTPEVDECMSTCPADMPDYQVCACDNGGDPIELTLPLTTAIEDPLGGDILLPPGLGPILTGLIPPGSIPPILLGFQSIEGTDVTVVGALGVIGADPPEQDMSEPTLGIPAPADWSCNPNMVLALDEFELDVSGFVLTVEDLQITGQLDADGNMTMGTLGGVIDPAPLADEFGIDPCSLLPDACPNNGMMELLIVNLVGVGVDTEIVEVAE